MSRRFAAALAAAFILGLGGVLAPYAGMQARSAPSAGLAPFGNCWAWDLRTNEFRDLGSPALCPGFPPEPAVLEDDLSDAQPPAAGTPGAEALRSICC